MINKNNDRLRLKVAAVLTKLSTQALESEDLELYTILTTVGGAMLLDSETHNLSEVCYRFCVDSVIGNATVVEVSSKN